MPQNFPEAWVNQVDRALTSGLDAPFLAGIPELDTQVQVFGPGSASELNTIHIPTTDFEPAVLINNTAYPIALVAYTDNAVTINLDKYQPEIVTLSDDQVLGASYDRIASATLGITNAILRAKYAKAAHALAPAANTTATPVLVTTGEVVNGRKRMIYDDLVNLKGQFDNLMIPAENRRFVPCSDHYNDMLMDRKYFGNLFVNYAAGTVAPLIAGFEIVNYFIANPYYSGTTKLPYGAVPVAGNYRGSFVFYTPNIAKKTGFTKQYYLPAALNPQMQTNELGYRHYFIAVPKRIAYMGGLVSAAA